MSCEAVCAQCVAKSGDGTLVGRGEVPRNDGVQEPLGVEEPAVEAGRQLMITCGHRDLDRREHTQGGEQRRRLQTEKLQGLVAPSGGGGDVAGGHRLYGEGW